MIGIDMIGMLLSAFVALLTVFTFFQTRMTTTEKRLTILEQKDIQTDEKLEEYKVRLDNHDRQTEVMIRMSEQLNVLNAKVDGLAEKLEREQA